MTKNVEPTEWSDSVRHDPQLMSVIDRITERLDAGQSVDIEQYVIEMPQHADYLRQLAQTLRAVAELGRAEDAHPGSDTQQRTPKQIGEFSIVREIGRGGMGIVYEATQGTLDRRVALKVFPFAGVMDPRQLGRFKNEARAAATLHHPNIVPVFSVGSDKSVHYYAMQLIDGPSVAELLAAIKAKEGTENRQEAHATPDVDTSSQAAAETVRKIQDAVSTRKPNQDGSYERKVAQWGVQAAEALAYAHENGVLHRDIKPANLLIDRSGKLWITDFGLARFEKDASLTVTGDLIGTLRYMSPEQALAKRVLVDHRTDIYSLGVTIYEMLTKRPAFSGDDRQQLLRQIAFADPVPIRTCNPALPRELETIVLKSTEKNPDDRYVSAQELADDLRRFLEHLPIRAKRPSLLERAAKWAGRHRAGVAAGCLAVFVIMLSVGILQWRTAERIRGIAGELRQTNNELRQATAHADATLDVALGAVESQFSDEIEAIVATQPDVIRRAGRFRQHLAETYETMLNLKPENVRVRLGAARACLLNSSSRQKNGGLSAERAARTAVALVQDIPIESLETNELAIVAHILTSPPHIDTGNANGKRISIAAKARQSVDQYAIHCGPDVASQHRLFHFQLNLSRMLVESSAKEKNARQAISTAKKSLKLDRSNAFSHALLAIALAEGTEYDPEFKSDAIEVIERASRNKSIEASPSSVLKALHGKLIVMTARDSKRRVAALDLLSEATQIFELLGDYDTKHVRDIFDAKTTVCQWQIQFGDLTGAAETANELISLLELAAEHNQEILQSTLKMREAFCFRALALMILGEFDIARETLAACQAIEFEWTEARGVPQPTEELRKEQIYRMTGRIGATLIGRSNEADTDFRLRDAILHCVEHYPDVSTTRHYLIYGYHPDPKTARRAMARIRFLSRTLFEESIDRFNYFRLLDPQMLGPWRGNVDFAECHRMMEMIKKTRRVGGPLANEWCASYAWSLYRLGRIEEANRWFIQATDSEPFKLGPLPTLGLAITYHKLGQTELANHAFQDGLEKADSRYGNFLPRDIVSTLREAAQELGEDATLAAFLAGRQTP